MHVVVGLGNPGDEYRGTRHNVGFEVVERLAARNGIELRRDRTLNAVSGRGNIGGHAVLLVEPMSYMNLSGAVVLRAVERSLDAVEGKPGPEGRSRRKLERKAKETLLVVSDDYNLPLGTLRMRGGGSAGGHNGLTDVERALGTREYPRLRMGIGVPNTRDSRDFVLRRFHKSEQAVAEETFDRAADAVESWLSVGLETTMARYNGGPKEPPGRTDV
ncbi:MAG: aminoacyl-tRNA hydrolase [Planctomycetota bacterium]